MAKPSAQWTSAEGVQFSEEALTILRRGVAAFTALELQSALLRNVFPDGVDEKITIGAYPIVPAEAVRDELCGVSFWWLLREAPRQEFVGKIIVPNPSEALRAVSIEDYSC